MPNTLTTVDMRPSVRAALQDVRTALRETYGDRLQRLIVFGSHARGDARTDSDVDVLIVLGGDVDPLDEARRTSDIVIDVAVHHGVSLSLVHLSEDEFTHQDRPLLRNIDREGVAL